MDSFGGGGGGVKGAGTGVGGLLRNVIMARTTGIRMRMIDKHRRRITTQAGVAY